MSALGSSAKGLIKMALQSRRTIAPESAGPDGRIIILANGPSLRDTIARYGNRLAADTTLAVNFFANTEQFRQLRPRYYVLADPHFFSGADHDNLRSLWANLAATDWPMTLCVPVRQLATARCLLGDSAVRLATFNFVGLEGFGRLERVAYGAGLAMPRPRNVLIPAIMCAIAAGFREIYLTGADHSWLQTISVTERNEVASVQPHFYKDSDKELARSTAEYRGYRLHDILRSFYVAFSGYHRLRRFADARGIRIINATPGSFIDAFERQELYR